MSQMFYHVMQDNAGNLFFDVSGTMRLAGTGTLATIYGDEALTVRSANPMTNHPCFGSFKCFLGVGDYDFYMAKSGYTFETLTGVQGSGTHGRSKRQYGGDYRGEMRSLANLPVDGHGRDVRAALNSAVAPATWSSARRAATGIRIKAIEQRCRPRMAAAALCSMSRVTSVGTISDHGHDHDLQYDERCQIEARRGRPHGRTGRDAGAAARWRSGGTLTIRLASASWRSEVAAHVQGVITGRQMRSTTEGGIVPQMIDYSKLVPFLVGAIKTLAARVAVLEDALGV